MGLVTKKEGLDIKNIGATFSREGLLVVYGNLDLLKKEYGGKYKKISKKEFETLRWKKAHEQARMLALKEPQIDSALNKYIKKDKKDAGAIKKNIKFALANDLVKEEIKKINQKYDDAKSYSALIIEWKATDFLKKVGKTAVLVLAAPFLLLGCERQTEEKPPTEMVPVKTHFEVPTITAPQNVLEPHVAYDCQHLLFTLVSISGDLVLKLKKSEGTTENLQGQFLYIKSGDKSKIVINGAEVNHAFYDPTANLMYYTTTNGVIYQETALSNIEFYDDGNKKIIDLTSILKKAQNAETALAFLKTEYFGLLEAGLAESTGEMVDLSWLNASEILSEAGGTTIIMTTEKRSNFFIADEQAKNIVINNIEDTLDDVSDLVAHEFTHTLDGIIEKRADSPILLNSINQWLNEGIIELLSNFVQKEAYGSFSLAYGPDTALAAAYLAILGPNDFMKAIYDPEAIDVGAKIASICGNPEIYEKIRVGYYIGNKGAISSSYDSDQNVFRFFEMPFTMRLLSLLPPSEQEGVFIYLDRLLHKDTVYLWERYGLTGPGIPLNAILYGGRVINWSQKNQPFNLILDLYLNNPNAPIIQRYKPQLILLSNLNKKIDEFDFSQQQIAFGVLANMTLDFVNYWNSLSTQERTDKIEELSSFIAISEVYALRNGYSFWASISAVLKKGLDGTEINLTEKNFTLNRPDDPQVRYLKVDTIEFNIQTPIGNVEDSEPWADIANGSVKLYLKEPFSYDQTFFTEGAKKYRIKIDTSEDVIELQYTNETLTSITGINSDFQQTP